MTTSCPKWRIVGINFDHMHMGDLLRLVFEYPNAEIVGLSDKDISRMRPIAERFQVSSDRLYTDFHQCLGETNPDIAILCPKTGEHAEYVEWVRRRRACPHSR